MVKSQKPNTKALRVLDNHFTYNPETGVVVYDNGCEKTTGQFVQGYIVFVLGVGCSPRNIRAHNIAWYKYTGEWPSRQINHKNHIRRDNRITNLEDINASLNNIKRRLPIRNASNYTGIHHKRGVYMAKMSIPKVSGGTVTNNMYIVSSRDEAYVLAVNNDVRKLVVETYERGETITPDQFKEYAAQARKRHRSSISSGKRLVNPHEDVTYTQV